jgi:hypothetical protein
MCFYPWEYHYDNTTHKCTSHVHNTHITQNSTTKNKQNKEKQISSQSYTNNEGHITANEYSVEKGEEMKLSLIQALETY